MKKQFQDRTNVDARAVALGLSLLVGAMSPEARALEDGAAPKLAGLKIATPAGDAVEMSTKDESLSSVALEVSVEADKQGVAYLELRFRSSDGARYATYSGSGTWTPTTSEPLKPRDETNVTFKLGAGRLSKFYDAQGFARPLDVSGTWTLDSVFLLGKNGKNTFLSASSNNLPVGLTNTKFLVTRWFSEQPVFTTVVSGGTVTLAPVIDSRSVTSPSYQWFRNGTAISGATKLAYSKTNVNDSDAGLYYLEVTSAGVKVRSDAVPVSVRSADVVAARSNINLQNFAQAKQKAEEGLKVSRDGAESLFVSALSELLGVLTDPLSKPLLVDMGASVTPKIPFSDFNWSGTFPATANSAKFNTWVLSVLLPTVERAEATLAKITDRRFVTWVSEADFGQWSPNGGALDSSLLVDYGDIQMLRVGLNAISAFFRLWSSLDTSVRLDSLQALLPQGKLSVESILKEYPNLLAAAPNGSVNQSLSVDAMARAAGAYANFSDFVFNPTKANGVVTRYIDGDLNLFNASRQFGEDGIVGVEDDPYFRDLFSNIAASATGGTREFIADTDDPLVVKSRYPVNLKALKERPAGVRSAIATQNFVPAFKGNLASETVANGSLNGVLPLLNSASLSKRIAAAEPAITKALGTRGDQVAPSLDLVVHPAHRSKVLVGPESGPIVLSGKVRDESELNGVFIKLNRRGLSDLPRKAILKEGQSAQVGGKTIRSWDWTLALPDLEPNSNPVMYSVYAEDQFKQQSTPKTGSFGVAKAVRVTVASGSLSGGSVSVVPVIPANGLVEVGTRLRVSALANTGSLFSKFEVKLDGSLQPAPGQQRPLPTLDVFVSNASSTIEITPVFVANPFPSLAGQWTGLAAGDGVANLTVTRTGTFTLRVRRGRATVSYAGVMDASGRASIPAENLLIELNNGVLQLRSIGPDVFYSGVLARAANPDSIKSLPHTRFNAALVGGADAAGYFTFEAKSAAVVVSTGMVNLPGGSQGGALYPPKTVRYSFSTPLLSTGSGSTASLRMVFASTSSVGDIGVTGSAMLRVDGGTSTLEGAVGFSTAPASSSVPAPMPDVYRTTNVTLAGYGYKAPGIGDWVLPSSQNHTSLTATVAKRRSIGLPSYDAPSTMGKLDFKLGKLPTFVSGDTGVNPFVTNKTTLRLSGATGLFTGNLVTQVNGVSTTRAYSGVVLRAAGSSGTGPLAVGLSSDGLLILFAPLGQ
jgi:hypothetical protein